MLGAPWLKADVVTFRDGPWMATLASRHSTQPGDDYILNLDLPAGFEVPDDASASRVEPAPGVDLIFSESGAPLKPVSQTIVFEGDGWKYAVTDNSLFFWAFAFGAPFDHETVRYSDGSADVVDWPGQASGRNGTELLVIGWQPGVAGVDFSFGSAEPEPQRTEALAAVPEPSGILLAATAAAIAAMLRSRRGNTRRLRPVST